ncbi:PepSY domain-containing protein [Psychrobacter sp. AH5]|uniref:PepSY domain-containing protein n=1 Tax=Psychrobacter sp. AH5 TaxID=2937433 RepID=UPI00334027BA
MSLPLLKPLLLTVGATSLVFFGGVIALSVQSPNADNVQSAANTVSQNPDITSPSLSSFKALVNPLSQSTQTSSLAALTAEQATALAKQKAPDAILQATPELINYNGTVAYEVLLDSGPSYVDANLGAVLNPVASSVVTSDYRAEDFDYEEEDDDHDDYKDKHHDDDNKHRNKKHDDKRYKESGRLIATSYQQHDEDEYDD